MIIGAESESRPVQEYLYKYYMHRKDFRYLYYCKNCMINFDSKERVSICEKCGLGDIVELPKEHEFAREKPAQKAFRKLMKTAERKKMHGGASVPAKSNGSRQVFISHSRQQQAIKPVIYKRRYGVAFLRLRILLHYLTS